MTVREIIEALSKLPGHLPVAGAMIGEDGPTEIREVSEVKWEGRFVSLDCDGPYPA